MGPVTRLVDDWQALCRERGEPSYRASQIFTWIHRHGVLDPDAMSNLPKSLRGWLADEGLAETLRVARVHRSGDDTRKLLVRLADGAEVETVLLPVAKTRHDADAAAVDDDDEEPDGKGVESVRVTQCISTQVGCAMGCVFCASGI